MKLAINIASLLSLPIAWQEYATRWLAVASLPETTTLTTSEYSISASNHQCDDQINTSYPVPELAQVVSELMLQLWLLQQLTISYLSEPELTLVSYNQQWLQTIMTNVGNTSNTSSTLDTTKSCNNTSTTDTKDDIDDLYNSFTTNVFEQKSLVLLTQLWSQLQQQGIVAHWWQQLQQLQHIWQVTTTTATELASRQQCKTLLDYYTLKFSQAPINTSSQVHTTTYMFQDNIAHSTFHWYDTVSPQISWQPQLLQYNQGFASPVLQEASVSLSLLAVTTQVTVDLLSFLPSMAEILDLPSIVADSHTIEQQQAVVALWQLVTQELLATSNQVLGSYPWLSGAITATTIEANDVVADAYVAHDNNKVIDDSGSSQCIAKTFGFSATSNNVVHQRYCSCYHHDNYEYPTYHNYQHYYQQGGHEHEHKYEHEHEYVSTASSWWRSLWYQLLHIGYCIFSLVWRLISLPITASLKIYYNWLTPKFQFIHLSYEFPVIPAIAVKQDAITSNSITNLNSTTDTKLPTSMSLTRATVISQLLQAQDIAVITTLLQLQFTSKVAIAKLAPVSIYSSSHLLLNLYDLLEQSTLVAEKTIWYQLGCLLGKLHYYGVSIGKVTADKFVYQTTPILTTNNSANSHGITTTFNTRLSQSGIDQQLTSQTTLKPSMWQALLTLNSHELPGLLAQGSWAVVDFSDISFYHTMGTWADQDLAQLLHDLNHFNQDFMGYFDQRHWNWLLDGYQAYFTQQYQATLSETVNTPSDNHHP